MCRYFKYISTGHKLVEKVMIYQVCEVNGKIGSTMYLNSIYYKDHRQY